MPSFPYLTDSIKRSVCWRQRKRCIASDEDEAIIVRCCPCRVAREADENLPHGGLGHHRSERNFDL